MHMHVDLSLTKSPSFNTFLNCIRWGKQVRLIKGIWYTWFTATGKRRKCQKTIVGTYWHIDVRERVVIPSRERPERTPVSPYRRRDRTKLHTNETNREYTRYTSDSVDVLKRSSKLRGNNNTVLVFALSSPSGGFAPQKSAKFRRAV